MIDRTSPRSWRCRACGKLLGVDQGRELHVKLKGAEMWIVGTCRQACRRCGEGNVITVGTSSEKS